MSNEYHVYGRVYNVAERQKEMFGEKLTDDESWYEYEVFLENEKGVVISEWDSKVETYNGVKGQRLSEKSAREAIEEIKEDINEKGEDPSYWFNV
jgi:hypothetical protein